MNAMSREGVPINPAVLRWARTRAAFTIEDAAKRINTSAKRLEQWEAEDDKLLPTVRQARDLAKLYDRPFFEFFARDIPDVPPVDLVPDYRFHRKAPSDKETFLLRGIQGWAEECRLNALDLLGALGEPPPALHDDLLATTNDDVEERSRIARHAIGVKVADQIALKSAEERLLPNMLRAGMARSGILVLYLSALRDVHTRGICFFAKPLPVVVYGRESPTAQAFTLCHELGHVMLRSSAISGTPRFGRNVSDERKRVEDWCNRFSAAFLMPKDAVEADLGPAREAADWFDDIALARMARRFSVSRHAMLIRLVNLRYVKSTFYWRIKRGTFLKEEEEYQGGGRPLYFGSRYKNSRGDFYTGLVLEAWEGGLITGHNAAEFMGINNLTHLKDIRDNFGN